MAKSITKRNATRTRNNIDLLIFTFFNHYFIWGNQTFFQAKWPYFARHLRLLAAEHQVGFQRCVIRAHVLNFYLHQVDLANSLLSVMGITDIDKPKHHDEENFRQVVNRKTFFKVCFEFQFSFDTGKDTEPSRDGACFGFYLEFIRAHKTVFNFLSCSLELLQCQNAWLIRTCVTNAPPPGASLYLRRYAQTRTSRAVVCSNLFFGC